MEVEEEKRPELRLEWKDKKPPFRIKVDSVEKLVFGVFLEKGEVADDVHVTLSVPPGFSFPGRTSIKQDAAHSVVPEFVSTCIYYEAPVIRGSTVAKDVDIKAPAVVGKFKAYSRVSSRGFHGDYEEFEVVVD